MTFKRELRRYGFSNLDTSHIVAEVEKRLEVLNRQESRELRIKFRDVQGQKANWSDYVSQETVDKIKRRLRE